MQLSDDSIWHLCHPGVADGLKDRDRLRDPRTGYPLPMITPFLESKYIVNGKSAGLSVASYDLRIAHDLTLGPHPGYRLQAGIRRALFAVKAVRERRAERSRNGETAMTIIMEEPDDLDMMLPGLSMAMEDSPPPFALAHTIENFAMPLDVSGQICDKSTYARMGLSCFNTFFDPGFIGNGTLELVNLSSETIVIRAGDPICQIVFNRLDKPVAQGYTGKYQYQPKQPVPAIMEGTG